MVVPETRDRSGADRRTRLLHDVLWVLAYTVLMFVGVSVAALIAGFALALAGAHVPHRTLTFVFAALLAVVDVLAIGGYARRRARRRSPDGTPARSP